MSRLKFTILWLKYVMLSTLDYVECCHNNTRQFIFVAALFPLRILALTLCVTGCRKCVFAAPNLIANYYGD